MVTKVAPQLPSGIGDTVRPLPRFRIEHDSRRFDAGWRNDHRATIHFHFLLRSAIDVSNTRCQSLSIDENILGQSINPQFQILCGVGFGQKEVGRREECAHIAAGRALTAEMASGVSFVRFRKLRTAVRKIWHADLLATGFQNEIQATKLEWRQIPPIRIARTILHCAGDSDHLFNPRVVGIHLRVSDRPIHVVTVQRGGTKINVSKPRRTTPPEVCLSPDGVASRPHPLHSRGSSKRDFMIPSGLGVFIVHVAVRFGAASDHQVRETSYPRAFGGSENLLPDRAFVRRSKRISSDQLRRGS